MLRFNLSRSPAGRRGRLLWLFLCLCLSVWLVPAWPPVQAATQWTSQPSGTTNQLKGVACPSMNFCVAVGINGTILQWDGSSWSSQPSGTTLGLNGVACLSASFCMAVGNSGKILQWDGSSWSSQTSGVTNLLYGVACPTTNFCVAVGSSGKMLKWDGSSWSNQTMGMTPVNGVACASTSFCIQVAGSGGIRRWNGSSWNNQTPITTNNLGGVACPSTSFCMAVGSSGTILQWDGSSWSSQTSGTTSGLSGVACASTSFCVVVGSSGTILQWDGSSWSSQASGTTNLLYGVACPTTNFCVAVGNSGTVLAASPAITVQGNGQPIANGSSSASSTNATDFGNGVVGGPALAHAFTIQNSGALPLTLSGTPLVAVSGPHASDFTVTTAPASSVAVNDSTAFTLTFTAGAAGVRTATISIANNDSNANPYTFVVQGTGAQALQPTSHLTQQGSYSYPQPCTGSYPSRNCTLAFTLKNTSGAQLQVRYEQITAIGSNLNTVTVLNGAPSPGGVNTVVNDGQSVANNATFQPTFSLVLSNSQAYALRFKVYGYAGSSVVAAGADQAQAVALGEFEATITPDAVGRVQLFLPVIQR